MRRMRRKAGWNINPEEKYTRICFLQPNKFQDGPTSALSRISPFTNFFSIVRDQLLGIYNQSRKENPMCHDPIGLHGFSALRISSQAYRICAEYNRQLRHELFCNGEKPGAGIREGFRQKSRSFTSEPTAFGVIESFDFFLVV